MPLTVGTAPGGGTTPTGTGVPKIVGGVQQGAAALVVDADVSSGAAIAGTKVAPNFGAQTIQTTGGLSVQASASIGGATVASTGTVRLPSASQIVARNAGNSGDVAMIATDASDQVFIGSPSNLVPTAQYTYVSAINSGYGYINGSVVFTWSAGAVQTAQPITGYGAPYAGMNGLFSKTLTAAQSYDLSNVEYVYSILQFVTSGANIVRLPPPTNAQSYMKFVWNLSGGGTISVRDTNGAAAAATLASGTGAWFLWANGIVKQMSAAFTVA